MQQEINIQLGYHGNIFEVGGDLKHVQPQPCYHGCGTTVDCATQTNGKLYLQIKLKEGYYGADYRAGPTDAMQSHFAVCNTCEKIYKY